MGDLEELMVGDLEELMVGGVTDLKELVRWTTVPGADLAQNIVDLPASSELGDDSITSDGRFVGQSALGFDAATRSIKLFLALFSSTGSSVSTGSSGKLSMAVVSTVVVEPERELIDSVVISWL